MRRNSWRPRKYEKAVYVCSQAHRYVDAGMMRSSATAICRLLQGSKSRACSKWCIVSFVASGIPLDMTILCECRSILSVGEENRMQPPVELFARGMHPGPPQWVPLSQRSSEIGQLPMTVRMTIGRGVFPRESPVQTWLERGFH